MTTREMKLFVAKEFIAKYTEWLNDYNNLNDHDYAWKYGWRKKSEPMKDTQKSMLWFLGHVFSGHYRKGWEKLGISAFELYKIGFLSFDNNWSTKARIEGKADFYYISQNKAK